LSYEEVNSLCAKSSKDKSVPSGKAKKRVPAPDSDDELVHPKKPKKAGAARVSAGDGDLKLPRKKKQKQKEKDPWKSGV